MISENPTKLTIYPIRAFRDNYIWCVHNGLIAFIVDPGDHVPVLNYLQAQNLDLAAILITHHHSDHVGGLHQLKERYPNVDVFGPVNPKISGITKRVGEDNAIRIAALELDFSVMETPGHTLDHIVYYNNDMLFCGDTLFSAGCGRMFEGTPEVFYASLQKLANLPKHTRVYCTHEYTQANIQFALTIEPHNSELQAYANWVKQQREQDRVSLPSSIAIELEINPFLRCHMLETQTLVLPNNNAKPTSNKAQHAIKVFAALRRLKDNF